MGYLTGPVHSLADYQIEYNGLLLGPGTAYDIQPDPILFDMAAIKSMDQARVWSDGSWSGPDFADVLLPEFGLGIGGATQPLYAAAMATYWSTFAPATSPAPLWVKAPGVAALGVPAKTNKRKTPVPQANGAYAVGALQFRCPDPAWQSVPRTVNLTANGSGASGMVFPLFNINSGTYAVPGVMDFGSTAVSPSSGALTNAGNTPAWPYVVVAGPAPGFSVIIDGNVVTYGQTVPAGQTLTIDYATGLATLTGGVDRTYALTARNFSAVTATSSVFFSATTGTCAVTIADIWR